MALFSDPYINESLCKALNCQDNIIVIFMQSSIRSCNIPNDKNVCTEVILPILEHELQHILQYADFDFYFLNLCKKI